MKITELIAQHISEVYEGGNWTEVNIKDTLEDVGYREAATVTRASHNTIASLVCHLTFYNDLVIQRLSGNDPLVSESNGFETPALRSEGDWNELRERNLESARQLALAVKKFPEGKVFEFTTKGHSSYYKTLHGVAEHAHYHLGQMVILKKLIRQSKLQPVRSNSL